MAAVSRVRLAIRLCCMIATLSGGCTSDSNQNQAAQSYSAEWTQYGFDVRNSANNTHETELGPRNVTHLHEHWRLRVPGGATSIPVIADGRAYFGAWNGRFYAVDAESGEIQWSRQLTSFLIRSTALVAADRIYVGAGASLFALDRATGDTIFETVLDDDPDTLIDASPKRIDGVIILGVMHFENTYPKADYTSIGALLAVDARTGEKLWRVATAGHEGGLCEGDSGASIWSSAAIDPELGLLFVGTGESFQAPASNCGDSLLAIHYARDHAGERIAWKQVFTPDDVYNVAEGSDGPDADVGTSPNLFEADGRKLVGAGDKGGSYRVFDRRTGEMVWRKDLEVGPPPFQSAVGGVMTTAAISGDLLYLASNQFRGTNWILNDERDPSDTSILYALELATGEERWRVELPAPMVGGLTIANGVLYHPLVNGILYARAPATGTELSKLDLGPNLGAAPSVVDGKLYISAGFVMNGAQSLRGAFIASYGLADRPSVVRDAPEDVLEPLDAEQCRASLDTDLIPNEACGHCLCDCDATAVGHCDAACLQVLPCALMNCAGHEGDELRACIADACGAKLLPTYPFERALEVTPCAAQCAQSCGL